MSSYLISEILLILFIALWAWVRHDLTEERKASERLQKQNTELKDANSRAWEEIGELKTQKQKDLRSAIYHSVLSSHPECDPEELTQTIIDHLRYIGDISCVEDLLKYDFEYIVKVVLYAKDGLLEVYYNYELYGEKPFRIDADGEHIFLSEEEEEKMENGDYSFLFHIS